MAAAAIAPAAHRAGPFAPGGLYQAAPGGVGAQAAHVGNRVR
ncbi:MAG TPA: hypothetical protein VH372_03925 [Actinospica sp.]|nr:hypothetical protein [Actinospica sp.]